MDRREYRRIQLHLPVRLRWTTPLGQKTQLCETLDVSRGGLLVPSPETHAPGVQLWVTFPYDASIRDAQPEILAKVVRCVNGEREPAVALHLDVAPYAISNGDVHGLNAERRASVRRRLALPIHVRPEHILWFEEAMTLDISDEGVRFLSSREYACEEKLRVAFQTLEVGPWRKGVEFASEVVRAEKIAESSTLAVSVRRLR